jgi:hypothetical protein
MELGADPRGQLRADPGNGAEQPFRIKASTQSLELAPAAGHDHLADRGGDAAPDRRKRFEGLAAALREQALGGNRQAVDHGGRPAIGGDAKAVGLLLFKEVGQFAQLCRQPFVVCEIIAGEWRHARRCFRAVTGEACACRAG